MPGSIDLSSHQKPTTGDDDEQYLLHSDCSQGSDSDSVTLLEKGERQSMITPRISLVRSPWLFLIDVFLLVMVMAYYAITPINLHLPFLGDVTGYVPNFAQQIVVFGSHPEFISNHTSVESLKEAREHWIKLLPPGQGFIKVNDVLYDHYDFPKPIEFKGTKSLGTSMMHSLHCLYEIMAEYDMLALGMKTPGQDTVHMDHCFDYVRQMLMCGGDMALAGGDLPGGSSQLTVPHVCKNFGQMYAWLDEHKDNDQYQFGSAANHFVPP